MTDVSSPELNKTMSLVRKLSPEQRSQVVSLIRQLDGGPTTSVTSIPQYAHDWLLPGLEHELRKQGILMIPLSPVRLRNWAPNYVAHATSIRQELERRLRDKHPTQSYMLSLGRECAKCLLEYLRKEKYVGTGVTVGPMHLLRHVLDIPLALERSYPNYVAGGTLQAIIRAE